MSGTHIQANEAQKKIESVRQPEEAPARQHKQGPAQAMAPQVAYRHAQINRNGLRPADLRALQRTVGNRQVARFIQRFPVYRGGPHEAGNYVPRTGIDTTGPKRGLSTFEIVADIPAKYRPAQQIETDNLGADLEAVRNGGGNNSHVSILPTNDRIQQPNNPPQPPPAASSKKKKPPQPKPTYEKLTAWAQGGVAHPYTTAVMNARNGEMP